ncbi:MAG: SDR family oxidoreductase, partial [Alphaproteobacteria bacterium]
MDFRDKVVSITGASSGIGEALAHVLAERGAKLVLSARRGEELERVKREIVENGAAGEGDIVVLAFDVTDEAALDDVVARARDAFGRIDVLVNNAGISQRSLALETDMSVYRRIMEVDFFAPVALALKVAPEMVARGEGLIVVTASVAGKLGVQLRTAYCAAKHAVMGFHDALRAELAEHGVKVATIVPGFIRTDIGRHALKGDGSETGHQTEAIAGGMDPMKAARVIVRGLERGRPEIPVGEGAEMHALWIKRLFPRLAFRIAEK